MNQYLKTFNRIAAVMLLISFCAATTHQVWGQVALSPAFKKAEKPAAAPEKAVGPEAQDMLTLYPMAAPDPLLEYPLWPLPIDRKQVNPMPRIDRAVILAVQMPEKVKADFNQNYDSFFDSRLERFPVEKARSLLDSYGSALKEVRFAENLMEPQYDLQVEDLSSSELLMTLLPELQEMRTLGRVLMVRARLAIVEKRWKDVVADCRLAMRLSEIAGRSTQFIIGRLVGFAIAASTMETLQLAIQQPDCPNLYWSLAALPESRLFDVRDAMEFETVLMSRIFEAARNLPDGPIGEQEASMRLKQIADEACKVLISSSPSANQMAIAQLSSGMMVVAFAPSARKALSESDKWRDRADSLSAAEAVLRASELDYRRIRDRGLAWSMLPRLYWDEYHQERTEAFSVSRDPLGGPNVFTSLLSTLQPAMDAVLSSGIRVEQTRNHLMTLEALRMHAAQTGQLPETLEQLRPVPAWIDSLSAKPFGYERKSSTTAVLTRSPRILGDKETQITIELKEKP